MLNALTIIIIVKVDGSCKGRRSVELFNGQRISVLQDGNFLEIGCTSM